MRKNKYDELEEKIEPVEPIYKEATPTTEYEIEAGYVEEPPIIIGKPSFWDKAKRSLVKGTTFDFMRHFVIGFVGVGGTTLATTKNLAFSLIGGVLGGLVEGSRKVWSSKTAAKNGGTKNRLLEALMQLLVYLIDYWMEKRKAGEKK
jgi:hypothetical protein